MKKRKVLLIVIGFMIVGFSFIGLSYAYWMYSLTQSDSNRVNSECFQVTLDDKKSKGISLNKAYPVSDEEGLKQEGYTFTIKNVCNTIAYYQVNLEDIMLEETQKKLPNKYVKANLVDEDGKTVKNLVSNYQEVDPTIENATESHKLTSGSLESEQDITYTLKLWMDYDTPLKDETTNLTTTESNYVSKISVIASYQEDVQNVINVDVEEPQDYSSEEETITITAQSENYNITEYSFDNVTFKNILEPAKIVQVQNTYYEEGTYPVYFKDEVGNIKEQSVETKKLDQTGPSINIEEGSNETGAVLQISLEDLKSGLQAYQILDAAAGIDLEEEWLPLTENKIIEYTSNENKTIVIKAKDQLNNESTEEYEITKADTNGPEINATNELKNWGTEDKIILNITDDISGVKEVKVTKESLEILNETLEEPKNSYTKEIKVTENGTYQIESKDAIGNTSTSSIMIDKVDKGKPTQEIVLGDNNKGTGDWYQKVIINVTAKDNESGVLSAKYCTTTNASCTPETPANLSNEKTFSVTLGNNVNAQKVCVQVTDNVNLTSDITCSSSYKVDVSNPSHSYAYVTNAGSNSWYKSVKIDVTVQDNIGLSGAKYCVTSDTDICSPSTAASLTGTSANSKTFSVSLSDNAKAQKICVQVTDTAGRVSTVDCSNTYKVDGGNPVLSDITNSKNNTWTKDDLTLSWSVTENISGIQKREWSTNQTSWNSISENQLIRNTTQNNTIYFKVTDNAGNESSVKSTIVKIDKAKPTIGSATATLNGTNITFQAVTAADTGGSNLKTSKGYTFVIKDGTSTVGTYTSDVNSYTYVGTKGHSYTATITVQDGAGNTSDAKTSNSVFIPTELTSLLSSVLPKVSSGNGLYSVPHSGVTGTTNNTEFAKTEYRFAGKNPNNYVTFNNEKAGWRMIGYVNTPNGQRVKLTRKTAYATDVAWGTTHDWSKASLQITLNGTYYNGLQSTAKTMIEKVTWNLGSNDNLAYDYLVNLFYQKERGTTVDRNMPTTYSNNIGLPYPSDFGYATSGGSTMSRAKCLETSFSLWSKQSDCDIENWLEDNIDRWTITPRLDTVDDPNNVFVFGRLNFGSLGSNNPWSNAYPVLYLKTTVKVTGGSGTSTDPYILS